VSKLEMLFGFLSEHLEKGFLDEFLIEKVYDYMKIFLDREKRPGSKNEFLKI